ncbi:MAG: SDR family NAD(P)-dependent oxidoreductase [Acidimicrobiales bacterium]
MATIDSAGPVVIVTGAAQGIGRACAEVFLASGSIVIGADKRPADESVAGEDRYHHHLCDLAVPSEVDQLVERVSGEQGRLDVLVNNVGTHPQVRRIDDVSVDDFLYLVHLNLVSAFVAVKAGLPMLRASKGAIVNIGSLVGLIGQDGSVDYCATKGALSAMTKAIAIDEAPYGVRANNVCPGAVSTPLADTVNTPQQLTVVAAFGWSERRALAREVADVVFFLASPAASYITGQDLVVAGGADLGYGIKGERYFSAMYGA